MVNIIQNPLNESDTVCINCRYLFRRLIIPLNNSQFNIDLSELDVQEDEEIVLEHFMCEKALIDLDHIVVECNQFEPKPINDLLTNKF